MTTSNPGYGPNGGYRCMPRPEIRHGNFVVSAVRSEHIEPIRQWRNAQVAMLRQSELLTAQDQEAYYAAEIWPDKGVAQPRNILLSYAEEDTAIGYGGLVHIAWEHRRAEVSFLLASDPERSQERRDHLFSTFLGLVRTLAFDDLGLQRLFTETYSHRIEHMRTLERSGFQREGVLRRHVFVDGEYRDSILHGCLADEPGKTE